MGSLCSQLLPGRDPVITDIPLLYTGVEIPANKNNYQ